MRKRQHRTGAADLEEWVILCLVFLEPLVFTPFTRNPFAAKELVVAAAILVLAIARLAAARNGRWFFPLPLLPAAGLVAGVVGVHATLAALSADRNVSFAFTIRLFGYAALFLLVASRSWSTRFFRRFFTTVLLGTIVAGSYGLLQIAQLDPVAWADTFRIAGAQLSSLRIFSTFGHPNFFGSHLALALFLMAAFALTTERPLPRAGAAVGIVLGISCLLLTLNRGAWVGFLAAASLAAWLAWRAARSGDAPRLTAVSRSDAAGRALLVIAALTLLAAATAVVGSPEVRRRLAVNLEEPTIKSRLLIWSGAAKMVRERPLAGFGPGMFGRVFPFYRDERLGKFHDELTPVTHAHSEYLEIAAETGMIGLVAMAAFLAGVLSRGFGTLNAAASREEWVTTAAVLCGAVSILVGNLFGVELRYVNASLFLWLLLGLLAAARGAGKPVAPVSPRASRAMAAAACAGAALFSLLALRVFAGEIHLQRAEESLASGSLPAAAAEGRAAYAWNRADPGGLMLAGEALVRGKDYAGAREVYREVERVNPGEPLIGYDLALTDYLLGNYDAALGRIEAARKLAPDHEPSRSLHFDIWLKRGLDLVERGDLEGAKAAFRSAGNIRIRRRDPRAVFYLGNVHALQNNYGAAVNRFRKVLEVDPTFEPAAENLKKIEALSGR